MAKKQYGVVLKEEIRNIPISIPSMGEEEWQAVKEPITSGWITQGPKVAAFEKAFAERHQAKHAIACSNCTTGLHLILAALGVGEGDEVIIPAFTWVATANVVRYCGATPVFTDVERETNNIDPEEVRKKITSKTKAVMVVHLFGLCADMDAIRSVVPAHIPIIEDAACAAGAEYKGVSAGVLGEAGAFSFHPRKSITTGEGGMITSNNSELSALMEKMRNHGASISEEQRHHGPRPYLLPEFNLLGFNYRMTDLQGAVGLVQLSKLDSFISVREHWARYYREALSSIPWLRMPVFPEEGVHAWQAFVTYVDPETAPMGRNEIMEYLQKRGISTRPGTHAVHMLGYYRDMYEISPDDYPASRDCNNNTMAIPLHNKMSQEDYEYVVRSLHDLR
jgi:perosamine synthetase